MASQEGNRRGESKEEAQMILFVSKGDTIIADIKE